MADDEKSAADLAKWATSTDWAAHVKRSDVKRKLAEIHAIVADGDEEGDDDVDVSGAARVKLVVVGDGAVGKTSLLIVQATGKFPSEYVPTVFENYTAQMERNDKTILLHLWDTAGQEDYDRLRPLSYPGADVVLLCFSTVNKSSFEAVRDKWSPEVQHYVPDIPHILVGTKVDLRDAGKPDPVSGKNDPITKEMGEKMAGEVGACKYYEVCALNGDGMKTLFESAVDIVMNARGDDDAKPAGGGEGDDAPAVVAVKKTKKKEKGCLVL